eukprot:m.68745 g.68745  ORF g.68745 m.68745 type:complete len:210 (-) comp19922_c0_seq1:37-666(-)
MSDLRERRRNGDLQFAQSITSEETAQSVLAPISDAKNQQLLDPRAVRKVQDPNDLIQLAHFIQDAGNFTKSNVGGKLELISEQIRGLQAQARSLLEQARRDMDLSQARCNFKRIPGRIYHLYRKADPDTGKEIPYFSMLSPQEWGKKTPDEFVDSYRLNYDMSWTKLEDIAAKDAKSRLDPQLLGFTKQDVKQDVLALGFSSSTEGESA